MCRCHTPSHHVIYITCTFCVNCLHSALCTKALKCLNMSALWRVDSFGFCMHFDDAIYTCLHSKCWCLHCLHYHVQLLALAACHFGIGRQKKMSD